MAKLKFVGRQVLEDQVLAMLDDKSKVALVVDEDDLRLLILSLEGPSGKDQKWRVRRKSLLAGMQQLCKAAFS